jgi:hypothetical protein
MMAEHKELCDKINSLAVFIYENEKFHELCQFEQVRMIKQLGFMDSYAQVLGDRITSL